jgi:shikimate kinase
MKRAAPTLGSGSGLPHGLHGLAATPGVTGAAEAALPPEPLGAREPVPEAAPDAAPALTRGVVLVGLMGAGKTSVGRRLARLLHARFTDADDEIVAAAGMSIADIFASYGEPRFRELERRVVARLLADPPGVIALGGGAFIDPETRRLVKSSAVSVWLRAELDTLVARTAKRRAARPLLAVDDPRVVLERLMIERYPIYAEADLTVETGAGPADHVAERVLALIAPRAT